MSNSSIMSVRELIDKAFGEPDGNVVNFKIMQTVLYLLARQLRVLGRHVEVDLDPALGVTNRTTINVSELKMQATVPKKKKKAKLIGPRTSDANDEIEHPSKKDRDNEQQTTDQQNIEKKHPVGKPLQKEVSESSHMSQKKDYIKLLEDIEEQREKELRVIRQRANSREEAEKSPTPMASMESMELQYEKLLVVERLPSGELKPEDDQKIDGKTRQLSVVTQQQFQALAETVRELQDRFGVIASADFPDNIKLMKELRKGASLTDSMAALQMSARLDAAEKTLQKMLSLVTDLARQSPGVDMSIKQESQIENKSTGTDKKSQIATKKVSKTGKQRLTSPKAISKEKSTLQNTINEEEATQIEKDDNVNKLDSCITSMELDLAIQELQADILKEVTTITNENTESAKNALKIAKRLERKLEGTTHLESRMKDLEILVSDYADEITTLDSSLSAQMTNYQEQLTQMQHDLEIGLENMAEALANAGGDTAVMAELNTNFTYLQEDFDRTMMKQKELQEVQSSFHLDLKVFKDMALWEHIEKLREIKPDREEITDALRDKADLKSLNGLVTQEHFDAVRGNFEKNIGAAYDKFNNQELVWQKAIDDIFRELNEKIEWNQLHSLREDVNMNLEMLNRRIHTMMEILGEPRAAATTRKLFRDSACLSCASPANMDITQGDTLPVMPALPQGSSNQKPVAMELSKPKEDGDHDICYPGRPIKHTIDPRAQFCRRYCGGGTLSRPMIRYVSKTPSLHIATTGIGSDGKTYVVEEHEQPCVPCNIDNTKTAEPLEADQAPQLSEMENFEKITFVSKDSGYCKCKEKEDSVPLTPILPMDDDY